ncbi:hypothetical protein [Acaricomes phytoseiuli]|uniref:hypothetical protein n=1 Tax=Acaricomes phytoseiuli TaxID=291968 RepID=UPI00039B7892|nr:hypothetical protein [Acaricomes phytoseiuli]
MEVVRWVSDQSFLFILPAVIMMGILASGTLENTSGKAFFALSFAVIVLFAFCWTIVTVDF